jgi:hypothetical protein
VTWLLLYLLPAVFCSSPVFLPWNYKTTPYMPSGCPTLFLFLQHVTNGVICSFIPAGFLMCQPPGSCAFAPACLLHRLFCSDLVCNGVPSFGLGWGTEHYALEHRSWNSLRSADYTLLALLFYRHYFYSSAVLPVVVLWPFAERFV